MEQLYHAGAMFTYNQRRKQIISVSIIATVIIVAILVAYYALFLRDSDFFIAKAINAFSTHIFTQVKMLTLLGLFYTSLIGGLFFIFIPALEAIFVPFLNNHNPVIVNIIFILGFLISYSANYFIGSKLGGVTKKVIGARQFYKIKGMLNRRGALAIFGINALPLPSQPLAAILGVFNYNKARFYLFFLLGQVTKYLVITIAVLYFIR